MKSILISILISFISSQLFAQSDFKDPDEFLVAKGATEFSKRVEEAKPFVDVQIEREFPEPLALCNVQELWSKCV